MNNNPSYPTYREIGISCVPSSIANFGPLVITQDFGTPRDTSVAYVTGVIYQDANGNGSYDEGEGLSNVTVTPDSGDYYAITSGAGGFVIPLPASGSGTLVMTASGGSLGSPRTKTVTYTAGTNVKVDFTTSDAAVTLPTVTLSAPIKDASTNGQTALITVARNGGDTSRALKVVLAFSGTAVNGVDTNPLPQKVTIPAGVMSVDLPVVSLNNQSSSVKKLKVQLVPKSQYSLSSNTAGTKANVRILSDN